MQGLSVKVKLLPHFEGEFPGYQSEGASGFDVRAQLDSMMSINPGERVLIPTGLSFEIPMGYEIQVRPRSGWALNSGITVLNSPGTVDADYRGEVKIIIINHGSEAVHVANQERIAQLVVCPVIKADLLIVDELAETERGAGGFGSTGRK